MQLDKRAYDFIQKAKQAGASKQQVADFLRDKGYDVVYNPGTETQQPATRQKETPGLIEGGARNIVNELALGQGSRLAGVFNTAPGRVLKQAINPIGALIEGNTQPVQAQELTPQAISQAYQEGKQQYEQAQQEYAEAHPTADIITKGVGTVGAFLLPVGAVGSGVRGAVAASKVGKAGGKLGMLASRVAGETTAGALYEGVREGFGDGRSDIKQAGEGAVKGAALFGALGVLGGGARIAEEGLVETATKLATNPANNKILRAIAGQAVAHPVAAERGAMLAGLAAEGTTLGALPAYLNDQEITAKDIGTGLALAAGGRGIAEAASWAGGKLRRFANEPTKRQVEEEKERVQEIRTAYSKQEKAEGELMAAEREKAVAIREKKEAEQIIKDIAGSSERSYLRSASKIEKELSSLVEKEKTIGLSATEQELKEGLNNQLQEHIDAAEKNVLELAERYGWTPERRVPRSDGRSRYLYFTKDGVRKEVRISAHDVGKTHSTQNRGRYDLRLEDRTNLRQIEQYFNHKGSPTLKDLRKTADWYAGEANQAREELEKTLAGQTKPISASVQVSATDKEIDNYMKAHSKNPYMTEEKAAFNIRQAKERAARQITPQEKLPLQELVLRKSKEMTGKVIGQFNRTRPLQEQLIKSEMVTGTKVAADKNPVIRLNKLRNGGEQEALIAPVYDTAKAVERQYPGSIDGADIVLDAEKRIQFARNEGKVPEQRFLDIVEQYKDDAPVQQIVKEVRALNQKALDRLYESGRIDKTTYENWKKNDAYVPSWIEKYDEAGEQTVGNIREQYLRQYTGEWDVYQNPIFTSMQQAKQLDTFAELQTAKKEYLELASKTGDATKVPSTIEYKGGPVKFDKANQIVVWKEGQPEVWNVPERVAQYFNPEKQGVDSLPIKVVKALFGFPLRVYKGGTTAVSLGFSQNNIVRDVQGAVIGSEHGAYIGPDMIRSSMKELVEEAPIAKELHRQIGTQTLRDVEQLPGLAKDNVQEFVDMYKAIDKAGGEGTQRGLIARMFTTALPNGARKLARVSSKTTSASLDALSYAGNLGEETTRLSVFKSELKAAAKDQAQYDMWIANPETIPSALRAKAGEAAREVTLNFRRQMADWVEDANRYFLPYFKPSILGAMRGFEALTNPEIAPKAWRTIMNLGMLQGLINGKIVDKKQLEELEAYNNEMAGKNFLLRNKNGTLITIPLAQEFAPLVKMFAGVTELLYRKANQQQRKDIFREMEKSSKQMLENYVPGVGYFTEPSNLVVGQIPKAVVEEWVNRDIFSGTPIVSEYLMNKPASMQYTKSTPQTLVQASAWMAKHGYEISPMRLNHIAKTFGSNTAKEMLTLTDAALEANGIGELRPKKEVTDNPLVRRFVANLTAPYNQYNQDAHRIIEENKGGYEIIQKKETEGLPREQVRRYVKQYLVYKRAENSINNLNELRKKRKDIERKIALVGNALKIQYQKGKIDKGEYLRKREKIIRAFNTALETQNQLERKFQLEIIKTAQDSKKKK